MENKNNNTRRKFLDKGLKLGFVSIIGGFGLSKLISKSSAQSKSSTSEKIELMTTDGTLIQVDSSEVVEIEHSTNHEKKYNVSLQDFWCCVCATKALNEI